MQNDDCLPGIFLSLKGLNIAPSHYVTDTCLKSLPLALKGTCYHKSAVSLLHHNLPHLPSEIRGAFLAVFNLFNF